MVDRKGTVAAWCSLLIFICLAAVWVALRVHVRNPAFGGCVFDPSSNSLVYFENLAKGIGATKVDLETGHVAATTLSETTLLTQPLGRGERLRFRNSLNGDLIGFEVFNEKTGERLVETELREPLYQPVIVGDRYLVAFQPNRSSVPNFQIVDVYAKDAVAKVQHVPFPDVARGALTIARKPLCGTSQFAVVIPFQSKTTPPKSQDHVVIFEIKDGETREVNRWVSGSSPANVLDYKGKLYSLSEDSQQVEIRELPSLQIIEKRPLPARLAGSWTRIQFHDGIGKFDNRVTGKDEYFRLPDFEPLDIPPGFQFASLRLLFGEPNQYVLLTLRNNRNVQYIVVDPAEGKTVLRRSADLISSAAMLDDHRLGIFEPYSGVSIDLYDLSSGNFARRVQPYAWLDWWIPLLAMLTVVNCVIWIYAAHAAGLSAATSALTLTTLVGGVSLFGCVYYGSAWQVARPCVCYLFVVLACLMFVSGWYAALGKSHWSRRLLVQMISLCIALQTIAFMHSQDDEIARFVPVLTLLIMVFPASFISIMLWIARHRGLTWEREQRATTADVEQPQRIALTDYFWLTAASGLLIMSLAPLQAGIWDFEDLFNYRVLPALLLLSLLALVAFPVAVLTMSRSRLIQRIMFGLMVASGAGLVADVTSLFWYGPYYAQFLDLTLVRIGLAIVFSSYLFFTAWRLEGWRISWRRQSRHESAA